VESQGPGLLDRYQKDAQVGQRDGQSRHIRSGLIRIGLHCCQRLLANIFSLSSPFLLVFVDIPVLSFACSFHRSLACLQSHSSSFHTHPHFLCLNYHISELHLKDAIVVFFSHCLPDLEFSQLIKFNSVRTIRATKMFNALA